MRELGGERKVREGGVAWRGTVAFEAKRGA